MQRLFYLGVVATWLLSLAPAQAQAPPKRHLVFSYTVGIVSDQHEKSSAVTFSGSANGGNGGNMFGTGDNAYKGQASDKGQITADIGGVEADGGLIVTISETGRDRNSAPTTCVVYATTNVICPGTTFFPEEVSIIRVLSPKFFDPAALDAKRHWNVNAAGGGVNIDFTATPQGADVVQIDSQRNEKTPQGDTTNATAKYTYAFTRLVPTSLKEYTTIRQELGPGQYANVTLDVTADLVSDSSASH